MPTCHDVLIVAGNARSLIANRGDMIHAMRSIGLSVGAIIPDADYLAEVEDLDIDIYPIEMGRTGINPLEDIQSFFVLCGLMRKINPRVVFCCTVKPVVYGSLAAKIAGVPRIYSMITGLGHVFTTDTMKTRMLRYAVSIFYKVGLLFNHKVFFQNPDDLQEFLDKGVLRDNKKAVRVYGSGVNMQHFVRQPLPEGHMTFLFLGRLLTEKGIAEFCEAARCVKADYPRVRFIAVGPHDPNLPHSCKVKHLERWRNEGIVEFVGGVKDVRPWIALCSVFVLPSYREGTPRAVLEAMSIGRPIITCDAPGCRETVEDGVNGFLVEPRQSAPLASAMRRFLNQPELVPTMAEASWQLAKRHYDVRKVNKVILEVMELI